MSCTEITLDGAVTGDFIDPDIKFTSHAPNENHAVIAPWLATDDTPPTPPPKQHSQRSFGFAHKPSFTSFTMTRQPSATNLTHRSGRPSETPSFESATSSASAELGSQGDLRPSLRKAKSSINAFTEMIRKSRSKTRLRSDSESKRNAKPHKSQTLLVPAQETFVSFIPHPPSPPPPIPKGHRIRTKPKDVDVPPPLPPKEPEFTLDTNLDQMDGIVDMAVFSATQDTPSSPATTSGFDSGFSHSSETSLPQSCSPVNSMFSNPNPFDPNTEKQRLPRIRFDRKVSPKTIPPSETGIRVLPPQPETLQEYVDRDLPDSPSWIPPESWAVEKEGDEKEPEYSSSEESALIAGSRPLSLSGLNNVHKRKSRRRTTVKPKPPPGHTTYRVRINRTNGSYHVASISLDTTVAQITPLLNHKLLLESEREVHKLYLKERGRERVLAQTEKPADIVRRRLEQAGFDVADGLDLLGAEDMTYLMKFVYKSQLLGPAEEELAFDTFEYIDLTGKSLTTVPVVLYAHADIIVSLNLSRNPMLEIPLDFIQSCTTLRELRLSHMAMKKVPQSVRHSVTLHRLFLNCNRIVDLDDAGLDRVPDLSYLNLQNNRMEKLPWYFPRLRTLKFLNISNNKFQYLPAVVSEMVSLVDLDISFNMISELPEQIGQLKALERLIIVGNQVTKFPDECDQLVSLVWLDCRRNLISDLSVVCKLPRLETIRADHNALHALDLSLGPCLTTLDASHNDITQLTLVPGPVGRSPYALTSLDISHAKLSSLDDQTLSQLTSLQILKIDHNSIRTIPDSLGDLSMLVVLSCSDNELDQLPSSIGHLQRLETLDAHQNCLRELPSSIWHCSSLCHINVTSNLLEFWHHPPTVPVPSLGSSDRPLSGAGHPIPDRKVSSTGSLARTLPPLAHSLERLYLGENRLTDEGLHPLTILKELHVLNLSFNDIQDIPPSFFKTLTKLEELYLSGNKLSTLPTEDLHRLTRLSVLFLNGNRLQTLPTELGRVTSLTVLDVGSNVLKYNINNCEFDWNWNFNQNLKYLNLSGNKRLEIKPDSTSHRMHLTTDQSSRKFLADFSSLTQLRVLGLMDVTTTFVPNIPDENEDRRVRTSLSEVNRMAYGIADNLGKHDHLHMFDLVQPEFRDRRDEAIFAMFGRAQPSLGSNRLSKYLHDQFLSVFSKQLATLDPQKGEGVPDALRRSFLRLNKFLHDDLFSNLFSARKMSQTSTSTGATSLTDTTALRSGACGIVVYFVDRTMYIANVGNALAVVSRNGSANAISRKHDPFDRTETGRIRSAEGWVSPKGFVNDEVDVSRSFGFYHLVPVVNARPDIITWHLSELDEFVIIGNRGLWDYVSYQTAVDIARTARADPMIAAQKLRDFAISYGAEGSAMIMVISVADLFKDGLCRQRQATVESLVDTDPAYAAMKRRKKDDITIKNFIRLEGEVPPPTGHLALVFTDIRNSTHLWEVNAGMQTAIRLHNNLLRRHLRFCGGYEWKTEGDAFLCSFPNALSALWWCLTVQVELLKEQWPLEILECEDGKPIYDLRGRLIMRGLSVRMGIHCGQPLCEPDPITKRMDYFGPMVNRSARISGNAAGGQIMISADIAREINAKILETEPETEYSDFQPPLAVNAIKDIGVVLIPVGEVKLKGLEIPEMLSVVYPCDLEGRQDLEVADAYPSASGSRVQFSVEQMRELALLCVRLETLSSSRVFRPLPERKRSVLGADTAAGDGDEEASIFMYGDPNVLLPALNDRSSDADLMMLLDSLSIRIDNALTSLTSQRTGAREIVSALQGLDERTLGQVLSALNVG